MTSLDEEFKATVRRNMLLGMWAAAKLGLVGEEAEAYAKELAMRALDVERGDVFSKVRKDFDAAGVTQSDEQILRVMETFMLQSQASTASGSSVDAAEVAIKRKLTSR